MNFRHEREKEKVEEKVEKKKNTQQNKKSYVQHTHIHTTRPHKWYKEIKQNPSFQFFPSTTTLKYIYLHIYTLSPSR